MALLGSISLYYNLPWLYLSTLHCTMVLLDSTLITLLHSAVALLGCTLLHSTMALIGSMGIYSNKLLVAGHKTHQQPGEGASTCHQFFLYSRCITWHLDLHPEEVDDLFQIRKWDWLASCGSTTLLEEPLMLRQCHFCTLALMPGHSSHWLVVS